MEIVHFIILFLLFHSSLSLLACCTSLRSEEVYSCADSIYENIYRYPF